MRIYMYVILGIGDNIPETPPILILFWHNIFSIIIRIYAKYMKNLKIEFLLK